MNSQFRTIDQTWWQLHEEYSNLKGYIFSNVFEICAVYRTAIYCLRLEQESTLLKKHSRENRIFCSGFG